MLKPAINQIITNCFIRFAKEFRQGKKDAFEVIMVLAISHIYGCYNPKQWADYLGLKPDKIYQQINQWSLYRLKRTLLKMMVSQAAQSIKEVRKKSLATQSRANLTLAIDDSVIDRLGNRLRCIWSWQAWSLEKGSNRTKSVGNYLDD